MAAAVHQRRFTRFLSGDLLHGRLSPLARSGTDPLLFTDALVNNVGISGRPGGDFGGQLSGSANVDDTHFVFEANVFGVVGADGYVPSTTALTSLTIRNARSLASESILVSAACPGFVATDLNHFRGVCSTSEGAVQAVRMARRR